MGIRSLAALTVYGGNVRHTVSKPTFALSMAALCALWLLDWHVARVNFGPFAAVPIFYLAQRMPRGAMYALSGALAAAFAFADADIRQNAPDPLRLSISVVALFAAYGIAAWSSRRFTNYRHSVATLSRALVRRDDNDVDFVSGTYTRAYFERFLLTMLSRGPEVRFALIVADLDDFKDINDRFGHLVGDAALHGVGERFTASVGSRGIVARLGGDEFVLLLETVEAPGEVATLEHDLRVALATPFALGTAEFEVVASFGSSVYPEDGDSRASLLALADARMYAGKRARRRVPTSSMTV